MTRICPAKIWPISPRVPGCRSATMAAVGADMRRQSVRQVACRCAQRPRPRLHAHPVDVDRPDLLALRFLIRQLPKLQIEPCLRSGFGLLAFRSRTRLGSPYNRPPPPPRSPIRRPYVACEQPAGTCFSVRVILYLLSVCFLCGSLCGLLLAALCGPLCGGPLLCGPLCGSSRRLLLAVSRFLFRFPATFILCHLSVVRRLCCGALAHGAL